MTIFAKKQDHQKSYETLSQEKSGVNLNEMQKSQPSLHNKIRQKQQLAASKTIETKICTGVDGVRKFTVKYTTNPYKRFRSKKNEACDTRCVQKLSVIKTSQKLNRKKREELHIRTLQTATTCSPSASVPLEQSINTFSEGNIKQTQFNIWHGRVFTPNVSHKNANTNWKTRR